MKLRDGFSFLTFLRFAVKTAVATLQTLAKTGYRLKSVLDFNILLDTKSADIFFVYVSW